MCLSSTIYNWIWRRCGAEWREGGGATLHFIARLACHKPIPPCCVMRHVQSHYKMASDVSFGPVLNIISVSFAG